MTKKLVGMLLGIGCVTTAAMAQDEKPSPYGAILATGILTSYDRDPDFGIGGQGILGFPVAQWVNVEVTVLGNILRPNGLNRENNNNDFQIGGGADFMFPLTQGKIRPFVLVGGGAVYEKAATGVSTSGHTSPYANGGAGVLVALNDQLSMRVEGRAFADFNDRISPFKNQFVDGRFSIGLQYAFDKPARPVVLPPPPPPVTPPPPPPPVDGDSDGDGVPDSRDKCPNTPRGAKVDANGCVVEQSIFLRDVKFDFDKSTLKPEAKAELDSIAQQLSSQDGASVKIIGHTDSVGTEAYNQKLSERRARVVAQYLVAKGVPQSRLRIEGDGESKPIAPNDTAEGRAQNRRTEVQSGGEK